MSDEAHEDWVPSPGHDRNRRRLVKRDFVRVYPAGWVGQIVRWTQFMGSAPGQPRRGFETVMTVQSFDRMYEARTRHFVFDELEYVPEEEGRAATGVYLSTTWQSRMRELLEEVLGMDGAEAERVAAALPELDRFRLDAALRFVRRATAPAEVFFFAESLVAAKQHPKCARVKKLFRDHATTEDKIELLAAWAFTDPYRFGTEAPFAARHVMYADCIVDTDWITENWGEEDGYLGCSTAVRNLGSLCPCERWLREKPAAIDKALDVLIGHLCDMRHSLVHESWPVFMVTDPLPPESSGSSMRDCYPCAPEDLDIFRSYESGITFERFKTIAAATVRNHLVAKYA